MNWPNYLLSLQIAKWNKDQKVSLKIDAEASFQDFVTITDMLAKNDIKNVAIVSMKDKGAPAKKEQNAQGAKTENAPATGNSQ